MLYNDDMINTDENFNKIAQAFKNKLQGASHSQESKNNNFIPPKQGRKPFENQFSEQPAFVAPPTAPSKDLPPHARKPITPMPNEQTFLQKENLQPNPNYSFNDMIKIIDNSNHLYNMMLFSEANLIELKQYLQKNRYKVQTTIPPTNNFLQKLKNQQHQFKSLVLESNFNKNNTEITAQKYTRHNSKLQILQFLHCENEILRLIFWMLIFTNVCNNKHQLSLLNEISATHLSITSYLQSLL